MPRRKQTSSEYSVHNAVRLVHGGAEYFTLLEELIDKATSVLHLQTYIYDGDETGARIADALIRAATREVEVYVLLDGYASGGLPSSFITKLENAGVHFSFFEPLFRSKSFYIGRRMHHKILVVDGMITLVGGINISNRYNDLNGTKAWLDRAVLAKGEIAMQVEAYCCSVWNGSARREACHNEHPLQSAIQGTCLVRMRVNDWVNRKTQVYQSYAQMFRTAQTSVIFLSSYFWPGRSMLKRLVDAAGRGVKVQLILTGISDIKIAKYAERYVYRKLFKKGIEIYEYQEAVLHGKMAACDRNFVTIGSYNVNNISAYASMEMNLDIKDAAFAENATADLEKIIESGSVRITEYLYLKRYHFFQRTWHLVCYEVVHLIFHLFTFYFTRSKKIGKS